MIMMMMTVTPITLAHFRLTGHTIHETEHPVCGADSKGTLK